MYSEAASALAKLYVEYVTSMLSLLKPSAWEPTKRSRCGALPSAAVGPSWQPTTCDYAAPSLHCTRPHKALQDSRDRQYCKAHRWKNCFRRVLACIASFDTASTQIKDDSVDLVCIPKQGW